MTDPSTPAHAPAVQGEDVSPGLQRAIDETCVAIRAAFDSDSVPTKNLALRRAHDRIARLTAELETERKVSERLFAASNTNAERAKKAERELEEARAALRMVRDDLDIAKADVGAILSQGTLKALCAALVRSLNSPEREP